MGLNDPKSDKREPQVDLTTVPLSFVPDWLLGVESPAEKAVDFQMKPS